MDQFDLGRLTDFDFEAVCKDIFEARLGVDLELFSPGRDEGVDLRYFGSNNSQLIIQCKHWSRSARSALVRHMKKVELPKVRRIGPARYILATTVEMTKMSKDSIATTLNPYMAGPSDCFGVHEIVSALGANPQIVQRHLRLWLSSTAVLQGLLNRDLLTRSAALMDEVGEALRTFAPNRSVDEARKILDERNVCLIAGIPGIGKTTLAQVLVAEYATVDFEIVEVIDLNEIDRIWDDAAKQLFYFDDFLGEVTLTGRTRRNDGAQLVRLLKRIHRSANKKIILTTREYILAQARENSETLAREDFSPLTFTLDLEIYTSLIRAEILYNHVFHSRLSPKVKAAFANPNVYNPIIEHQNFSPRLIALSIDMAASRSGGSSAVVSGMMANLDRPATLWGHVVENQLDSSAVDILVTLFSLPPGVSLKDLERAWYSYRDTSRPQDEERVFRRALKALDGTMIRVDRAKEADIPAIRYHNPSVRDYMLSYLADRPAIVELVLQKSIFFEQVSGLWSSAGASAGIRLMQTLKNNVGLLASTCIRTLHSRLGVSGFVYRGNPVRRAVTSLQIAEEFGLVDVAQAVVNYVDWDDLNAIADDGDDLIRLLDLIKRSTFDFVKSRLAEFAKAAVAWVEEDLSEIAHIQYAMDFVGQMGESAPSGAWESLAQTLEDKVAWLFEYYSERPDLTYRAELQEMLDHAAGVSNPEEVYEGYERIASIVRSAEESRANEVPVAPEAQTVVPQDSASEIYEMMSLLREGGH